MKKLKSIVEKSFNKNYQLIDGTDEIFEFDLAQWEYEILSKQELIERSAYFKLVDGIETYHYQTCNLQNLEDIHKNSSFRTKVFFLDGKYTTGYATHSLFPYRGKFHPQFIRALLNILEINPGQIVLDPMAGSATVAVEANILGIDSISLDYSPFCKLMGKVKTFGLDLDSNYLHQMVSNPINLLKKLNTPVFPKDFFNNDDEIHNRYSEIILLAYLDSVGFAKRSNYSVEKLFPRVLERYYLTIKNFQEARKKIGLRIGKSKVLEGTVLDLPIEGNSIDAIITSPPYSFAIDYVKNDQPQLEYLGCDLGNLRKGMIGLQGKGIEEKLEKYFKNIDVAMSEMCRVLKNGAPLIIIVGTNEIQTRGIRLEPEVIKIGLKNNLDFKFELIKPIRGIQNSLKNESIIFFTKNNLERTDTK